MMTDRELLELAARAVGLDYIHYVRESYPNRAGLLYGDPSGRLFVWNPLTDDGEALRLAVKLEMRIDISSAASAAYPTKHDAALQHSGGDPYAATRRAIVRAAAEIGRSQHTTTGEST